jgi:hypothetical protein
MAKITGNPELDAQLQSFGETLQRTAPTPGNVPAEPRRPALQLPLWPEPVRGGPNALLRSAFFAGIHSKKRKELGVRVKPDEPKRAVTIAAQQGITIQYAGDQLNQYDADVFFEALHRARYGVFGTIGRKVRLAVLDFGRSENSIHGCLADAELASDGGSGGTFGG